MIFFSIWIIFLYLDFLAPFTPTLQAVLSIHLFALSNIFTLVLHEISNSATAHKPSVQL